MSDLIKYNNGHVVPHSGLRNFGSTCYINGLMQCILSCTSINELYKKNNIQWQQKLDPIRFISTFCDLYKKANSSNIDSQTLENFIMVVINHINTINIGLESQHAKYIQQDSSEFLLFLLSLFKTYIPDIYRLFAIRSIQYGHCNTNNENHDYKILENNIIKVEIKDLENIHPNNKNVYYSTNVKHTDYEYVINIDNLLHKPVGTSIKCYKCDEYSAPFDDIIMVSEILIVQINKFTIQGVNKIIAKGFVHFPKYMFVPESANTSYVYKNIGYVKHTGSAGASIKSGHYFSHCMRGDNWYIFDDDKPVANINDPLIDIREGTPYLIFYHFIYTINNNERHNIHND
jgi:ubiquitin C-terminal hydrolase